MNKVHTLVMTLLLLFAAADSAFANPASGFSLALFYLSTPLLILLFTSLGGIYLITDWGKKYRRKVILLVAGYLGLVILAYVISGSFNLNLLYNVAGLLVAAIPLFGVLIGGYMIYLGIRSRGPKPPPYLAAVRTWRMLVSGIALVAVIIACAAWLAFSFDTEAKKDRKLNETSFFLSKIYDAEMRYFTENNTYSKDPAAIGLESGDVTPGYYQYEIVSADEKGFIARVWGNIDRDADLDIWEQTEDPTPYRIYNDELNKGVQIDPRDPKRYTPAD